MGCGCGRKTVRRAGSSTSTQIVSVPRQANGVQQAQVFQSATIRRAPTGPVKNPRKTV